MKCSYQRMPEIDYYLKLQYFYKWSCKYNNVFFTPFASSEFMFTTNMAGACVYKNKRKIKEEKNLYDVKEKKWQSSR